MSNTAIDFGNNTPSAAVSGRLGLPSPFYYSHSNTSDLYFHSEITNPVDDARPKAHLFNESAPRLAGSFQLLQLWEGYVLSVENGEMHCVIVDKTNSDNPDEEVSIPLIEVEPSEAPLIKPGAVFYWSIRYADERGRGRARQSMIRFRRIPPIKPSELEKSKSRAKYLAEQFNVR